MQSGIFKLDWGSIADAVTTAVVAAVIVGLYGVVTTHGFDVFATDWATVGKQMVNLGVVAGVVSLGQDFLSTKKGSVLGVTPNNEVITG